MASLFYNRYIPPVVPADGGSLDPPSAKRRRTSLAVEDNLKEISIADDPSRPESKDIVLKKGKPGPSSSVNVLLQNSRSDTRPESNAATDSVKKSRGKQKEKCDQSAVKTADASIQPMRDNGSGHTNRDGINSKHTTIRSRYEKATNYADADTKKVDHEAEDDTALTLKVASPSANHGLEPLPQPTPTGPAPKVSTFSALPEWLRDPMKVSQSTSVPFSSLALHEKLLDALKARGLSEALAIQSGVLPLLLPGPNQYAFDLCVSAATGSGKTLSYALPMVQSLLSKGSGSLKGLVIVPTRELVAQVFKTFESLMSKTKLTLGSALGSNPLKDEGRALISEIERYDPDAYRVEQNKEVDADEELMNWDFEQVLGIRDDCSRSYNYVIDHKSKVDILICTPGRLVEHIQSTKGFSLCHVEWLVLDEADRLLGESFQQWVDVVVPEIEYMPPLDLFEQQMMMTFPRLRQRVIRKVIFSATMTRDLSELAGLKLKRPRLVVLEGQKPDDEGAVAQESSGLQITELPATLQEIAVPVPSLSDKPLYLVQLLEQQNSLSAKRIPDESNQEEPSTDNDESSEFSSSITEPADQTSPSSALSQKTTTHGILIFTNNNEAALRLARLLALLRPVWSNEISTITKISSSSGKKALSSFRRRKTSILVATDRASRGLDLENLAHVVNYEMPTSVTNYVHRVGRTARAGKDGVATTLVAHHEARWFWRDVARGAGIGRAGKVARREMKIEVDEEERGRYEKALAILGEEAKGQ